MKKLLCLLLISMAALTSAPAQIQTIVASTNSPTTPNPGGGSLFLGGTVTVPTNGCATLNW